MIKLPIFLTASLVLYKPNFSVLERTLSALWLSVGYARVKREMHFTLTLVDNSDDPLWAKRIESWINQQKELMPSLDLTLLNSGGNLGYGRGNNLVIENIESDYHLVINPDLFLVEDALDQMLDYMQNNHEVGLLVPAVFSEDGERQYLCKRCPSLFIMFLRSFAPRWFQSLFHKTQNLFEMRDCDYKKIINEVQYPTGSCMFFRTLPLQQIKGFDPDYFLHYEDADIGRRILMVSRVVYVPTVRVIHRWARATHQSWKIRLITVRSGLIYWRKWGGFFRPSFVNRHIEPDVRPTEFVKPNYVKSVLVTGANGFIGRGLCNKLISNGYAVRGAVRKKFCPGLSGSVERVEVGSMDEDTNWFPALSGVDSIVHLAARVHVMHEDIEEPLSEFRKVNVAATINLARQAAAAGVKRFVFISSIKVNGEGTTLESPFKPDDISAPLDAYGISKLEAEVALKKIADETGMELVIIRPVLVYGPGVRGNFQLLMHWLKKGIPFPLGSVHNRRSFVSLDNLVHFIMTCLNHPQAANQTFLVSDGQNVSTPELIRMTASAMHLTSWLIPLPMSILYWVGWLFRREKYVERLCESLHVDIRKSEELLGWKPIRSIETGLRQTALYYLADYDL